MPGSLTFHRTALWTFMSSSCHSVRRSSFCTPIGFSTGRTRSSRCGLFNSRAENNSTDDNLSFWSRLKQARRHVSSIDTHDPFTLPAIGKLLDLLDPRYVVFEFTFRDLATWQKKIRTQQEALEDCLW